MGRPRTASARSQGTPTAHGNHAPHDPASASTSRNASPASKAAQVAARVETQPESDSLPAAGRIASNFLSLSAAEIACRGTSVLVTLSLAKCLGKEGFGKIEVAFNVVFWLVLLVRNGCEVIAARELARHPRLVRPLVNHLLFIKIATAVVLFAGLVMVGSVTLKDPPTGSFWPSTA